MFAFAIWNRARGELVLARDRFGVKPLYYALDSDGSIHFASEIKAILAAGIVRPELNLQALPDYLANHAPSGDDTLFAGIRRLPPGHTLTWRDGEVRLERYWELPVGSGEGEHRPERDLVEEYRERLTDAVRLRLMSDVPLGMLLSGGIDSAAITAVMSRLMPKPVKTFSVAFAEREANELAYARMVAERFGTDHHEVVVSPDEFFAALPALVWHEDEPIAHPSSIALNFVSRLASRHVKVVLTGEGSDETLAGYNRYRATVFNLAFGGAYERLTGPGSRSLVRRGISRLAQGSPSRRRLLRTFLYQPADLDTLYLDNFAVFSRARQRTLLSLDTRDRVVGVDPYAAAHRHLADVADAPLLARLLYLDTKTYLHELLMKQDQMSMAASIESRVPFLDHPVVEFSTRLPARMKLRGFTTKYVLREAMRGILPEQILSRRKLGFPVPISAWLRGPYRHLADEYILGERARARGLFSIGALRSLVEEHASGAADHGQRLWSLINLELWHRLFLDGEAPPERSEIPDLRGYDSRPRGLDLSPVR
jgi:asparagine synthase (glutamine-hydrolysing)